MWTVSIGHLNNLYVKKNCTHINISDFDYDHHQFSRLQRFLCVCIIEKSFLQFNSDIQLIYNHNHHHHYPVYNFTNLDDYYYNHTHTHTHTSYNFYSHSFNVQSIIIIIRYGHHY